MCLIDAIGASTRSIVAFCGFYESHCAQYSTVAPPQPSKWSAKWVHFALLFCLLYHLGGRRADTERVVARRRRLVSFMKALDLLHWAMGAVLHHRTAMSIEMASNGGTFVHCRRLFCLDKRS